jgi:hypothetical protein
LHGKMVCPGWREVGVKVVGPPRRTAYVKGARGLRPRGRPFEEEVPTVAHGMRWVGLDAARAGAGVLLDVNGAGKGEERGCLL